MKQSIKDIILFLAMIMFIIYVGWKLGEYLNHLIRGW